DMPDLIRRATGIDLPYQVLSSDEWVASRLLADKYRDRRVFLAGGACHLHPPFGGYGMNMGVAVGVVLGWNSAGVLQGWGGQRLRGLAGDRRRRHFARAPRLPQFHSLRAPGLAGAACLAARRVLALRPLRPGLHVAGDARLGRGGDPAREGCRAGRPRPTERG